MSRRSWILHVAVLLVWVLAVGWIVGRVNQVHWGGNFSGMMLALAVAALWHVVLGVLLALPFVRPKPVGVRPNYYLLGLIVLPAFVLTVRFYVPMLEIPYLYRILDNLLYRHLPADLESVTSVILGYALVLGLFTGRPVRRGDTDTGQRSSAWFWPVYALVLLAVVFGGAFWSQRLVDELRRTFRGVPGTLAAIAVWGAVIGGVLGVPQASFRHWAVTPNWYVLALLGLPMLVVSTSYYLIFLSILRPFRHAMVALHAFTYPVASWAATVVLGWALAAGLFTGGDPERHLSGE